MEKEFNNIGIKELNEDNWKVKDGFCTECDEKEFNTFKGFIKEMKKRYVIDFPQLWSLMNNVEIEFDEFIKKLKEDIDKNLGGYPREVYLELVDKLAGDELKNGK